MFSGLKQVREKNYKKTKRVCNRFQKVLNKKKLLLLLLTFGLQNSVCQEGFNFSRLCNIVEEQGPYRVEVATINNFYLLHGLMT